MSIKIETKANSLVGKLFTSLVQVHVFHLQTDSYAQHKALEGYYTEIQGLIDDLVEAYQGKYTIISDYKLDKIEDYKDLKQVITYFTYLHEYVDDKRIIIFTDSDLLNIVDEIK